MTKTIKV